MESELPDKVEKVIKVRMSALQSQLYKQMKKYKMIADGKDNKGFVNFTIFPNSRSYLAMIENRVV